MAAVLYLHNRRRVSKRLILNDMTDNEIFQRTRFTRSRVEELREMVENDLLRNTARSHAVPVETQLLAALQFYATGSCQWLLGRSCGLSQSAISHSINDVTDALVKLAPTFIKFPADNHTVRATKQAFFQMAHFPNVVGAIDGTHVPIRAPAANEDVFVNRKGVHTINVQAVCDANMVVTDLVAKWPGSSHDSFIWRSSGLYQLFSRGRAPEGWLLGTVPCC